MINPIHSLRLEEGRCVIKALSEVEGYRLCIARVEGSKDMKPSGLSKYKAIGSIVFF